MIIWAESQESPRREAAALTVRHACLTSMATASTTEQGPNGGTGDTDDLTGGDVTLQSSPQARIGIGDATRYDSHTGRPQDDVP